MGFWVARGIVQYQRTLKGSSLLAKYLLISGTKHQWNRSRKRGFVIQDPLWYNQKTGSSCLFFPFKAPRLAVLYIRAVLIINPTVFAQISRVSLSIPALNPSLLTSSLLLFLTKKCPLWHFSPKNKALLSAFKNC